jgi:exopolysaccharide biosynthesis polyprenyl glycosylphosphotransferase
VLIDHAAEMLEAGERRGRLLWERRLFLALGDGVAVAVAFLLAFNLRSAEIRHEFVAAPGWPMLVVLIAWYLSAEVVDGYRLVNTVNSRAAFTTALSALMLSFVALLGVFFIVPYGITRPTLLLWVPLAAVLVLSWRSAYQRVFAHAIFAGSLLVIADRRFFDRVWAEATAGLPSLYRVLDVIDPQLPNLAAHLAEVGNGSVRVDLVVGSGEGASGKLLQSLVGCCERGVPVRLLTDLYEEMTGRLLIEQLDYGWVMSLPRRSGISELYAVFKRSVDLLAGAVALAALAIVFPILALAIKLEDRGPILYRQTRVGRYGRPFEILKLRTMSPAGAAGERQTDARDPRVTRVGRELRRLHLDELPQAINILRGDMSLVGPRPEQPGHAALMGDAIDFYNLRLSVRPGLTGWAQVNFGYGAGIDGARKKLSYDLYYVRRQGFGLDLLILARTARTVLSFRGR